MKDLWSESGKLFHTFVSISVVIVSAILIAMGVFAAKNNTAMIESGLSPAMIYAERENQQISVHIGEKLFESDDQKAIPLNEILKYAPAPLCSIYNIYSDIINLVK